MVTDIITYAFVGLVVTGVLVMAAFLLGSIGAVWRATLNIWRGR